MKQTIPYSDTHETREGTALHEAIGAANHWHTKAKSTFRSGFQIGFLLAAAVAVAASFIRP